MDTSVALAVAYLQLNGYFALTELPVQLAERQGYRTATDVDVLAVRLPHAAETVPSKRPHTLDLLLGQDPVLENDQSRTEVLVVEVKRGHGAINRSLHDPAVLRFALRRTGCCPTEMIEAHAVTLAREGALETSSPAGHPCRIRIAAFAAEPVALPGVLCIGLGHCLEFIRDRLGRYEDELRGAYFRDPVLNLVGLVDSLSPTTEVMKETLHAP